MPACFQLTRKGTTSPTPLTQVDEHLCRDFGVAPHPKEYYNQWYSCIGLHLAMGVPFGKKMEESLTRSFPYDPELIRIAQWLQTNYTAEHWREPSGARS